MNDRNRPGRPRSRLFAAACGALFSLLSGAAAAEGPTPFPQGSPLIGCFKDQGDPNGTAGHDLSGAMLRSPAMTNDMCRQFCGDKGFPFAGTQAGNTCFCGSQYGKSGPSDLCRERCVGDAAQVCGGPNANLVSHSLPPQVQKGAQTAPAANPQPTSGLVGGQVVNLPQQIPTLKPLTNHCTITIGGGSGYSFNETQTWEVTGPPATIPNQPGQFVPLKWITTGTVLAGGYSYTISGSAPDQLWAHQLADGSMLVEHQNPMICAPNAINTAPPGQWCEFGPGYPKMTATYDPSTGKHTATSDQTFAIDAGHPYGFQRPATATGSAVCHWDVIF